MIFKQVLSTIVFLIGVNYLYAESPQKNLVPNSGFENITNFSLYPANTSATVTVDKKIFKEGKASVRIDISEIKDRMSSYTYVRLLPEKNYTLSFWYKTSNWQKSGNFSTKISLRFNKKNGENGSAGTDEILFLAINKPDSDWIKFTAEFKTPPSTYMCQLIIFSAQGVKGTLWLDSIELKQVVDSIKINKCSIPPQIDGKLNDDCWHKAEPLTRFYVADNGAKAALIPTVAYLCYDNDNIYVAFQNIEPEISKLKVDVKERDGSVWNDDCNEIFLAAPDGKIRQFIVNASNVQADGELYMRVPGDPYRFNPKWDGKWQSAAKIEKGEWITEIAIPFSDFNHGATDLWRVNLARKRHGAAKEYTHWNRMEGSSNNVNKFGFLKFNENSASLSRFVEQIVENPLYIERKSVKFKELLSEDHGKYIVGSWAAGMYLSDYPKAFQAKYSPEKWQEEQNQILNETGLAKMFGPAFPWIDKNLGGMDRVRELNKKYGMKFTFMVMNSSMWKKAVRNGAVYVCFTDKYAISDPTDPEMAKITHNELENYLKTRPDVIPYLGLINGQDEPTNPTYKAFSFIANSENKKSLETLDAKIKKDFGFGKFGIYDYYADVNSQSQSAFNHIAFWSWWSEQYYKIREKDRKIVERFASGVPYLVNFNSCSSFNYPDFTRISSALNWISCDPYPTSAMAFHGRDRALYHAGFSTKLIHDVAVSGVKTCVVLQGFNYHGRSPTPENIREWASQALKNGASIFYWYTSGPLRITIPDSYKEMLRINNLVSSMNELKLPEKTVTALFFSQNSRRGIMDLAQYSLYTLYVLLGEKLKTWFSIVNETMLKLDVDSLASYRLVYVPELKYIDSATAEKLFSFVENGGILVLFDPESFTWNIDGTKMNDLRTKLIGAPVEKFRKANNLILAKNYLNLQKGTELPLTEVRGRAGDGEVLAYDIQPPKDADVFAVYADGKPAAYERKVGKGKVIYFAAQPFGNAELVTRESSWKEFLSGLAQKVGEPENLGIWDFLLPAQGGEIEVKYVVQPTNK